MPRVDDFVVPLRLHDLLFVALGEVQKVSEETYVVVHLHPLIFPCRCARARIVRRRWGKPRKSKGYGFVDVGDEEEQKKAITALEGKEVAGRPIAVKIAVNAQAEDDKGEDASEKEGTPEVTIVTA